MPPLFSRDAKADRAQSYAVPHGPQGSSYERAKQAVADARLQIQRETQRQGRAASQSPAPPPFVTQAAPPPGNSASPSFVTQAPAPPQSAHSNYTASGSPYISNYAAPGSPRTDRDCWNAQSASIYSGSYSSEANKYSSEANNKSYGKYGSESQKYWDWSGFSASGYSPRSPPPPRASSPALAAHNAPPNPIVAAAGKKTLVLDLDETLIHSYFEPCAASFRVPMTMDGQNYTAYVMKRPGCEEFLRKAVELFEVVVWTASLECYAAGVIDRLEQLSGCGRLRRMYREDCTKYNGAYVKDLSKLGRRMTDVAILDNSPHVAALNPRNLINIQNYYNDASDRALYKLLPMLDTMASTNTVFDAIQNHP